MTADRTPGDFGAKLRKARERKGVSLRQIANATKISMAVLESLERNDLKRLPGGIFSRAFVRAYAVEVGLDPEATIQEFVTQFPQESATAGHATSDPAEEAEALESDRRIAGGFLWILIVSIPIAGAILYYGRFERRADQEMDAPAASTLAAGSKASSARGDELPPAAAAAVPASPAVTAASPNATAAMPSAPSAASSALSASPAGASVATEAGATSGDRLIVVLSARRPVWVSATVDGQKAIERLLRSGERQTIEVRNEMVLTAGDASAITWTLNGAEARPLGKAGDVVSARFNLNNFKDYLQAR
jgi:cytoskeletal protein RodZ